MKVFIPLLMSLVALADSDSNNAWNNPTHGYMVTINPPNPIATIPGQTVQFSGEVKFVDIDKDDLDENLGTHPSIRTLLKKENAVLKAYFPDELNEITNQVSWTDSANSIQFSFTTPILNAGAMNRLTVQVVDRSKNWDKLLETKAKLEQRILDIDIKIGDLARQNGGKPKQILDRLKKIAALNATKVQLQGVVATIQDKIIKQQIIVAEMKLPVQLGNTPTAQGYSMNIMGGFMFESTSSIGVIPQQQSDTITSRITRLKVVPKNDTKNWKVEYNWNGTKVNEQIFSKIDSLQTIDYTYTAQNLLPSQLSLWRSQVSRIRNTKSSTLWGFSELRIPVVLDNVAPTWAASSSFDTQARYAQSFDALSISVEDAIGTLDLSSLTASINSADVKSSLSLISYNNGAGLSLSGDLNAIAPDEGDYTVSLSIADTVGHLATPNPKTMRVSIDRTAPVIGLNEPLGSSFRDPSVTFSAIITVT